MKEFLRNFFGELKPLPKEEKQRKSPIETPEEAVLETHEKKGSEELFGGSNETIFVELRDDGSGMFKPQNGEVYLRENIKKGTYFKRERAAYLVDRFLGFNLVPPTVIREIDGEVGSMQQFIPDSKTGKEVPYYERDKDILQQQLIKLWIFDYIIYNSDRHDGNFLVKSKENKLYAIDNGLSFGDDYLLPYKQFFDIPIPPEITNGIGNFLSWQEGKKICEDLLKELLNPEEVKACMRRIEKISRLIKKHGKIPSSARGKLTFS